MVLNKILLPIALPHTAPRIVHQAVFLARHFHSKIILLHVVTPLSYPLGVLERGRELTERDLHAGAVRQAQEQLDQALVDELAGIEVQRVLLRGEPAHGIAQIMSEENVDLIAMSTHSHSIGYRFLLGSVTAKVLHRCDCPLWIDAYAEGAPVGDFGIRNVLCAVDLSAHSRHTLLRAAQVAAEFGARLTLVHVTASVEAFGPGGSHVEPEWKEQLVGIASRNIAKLQQEAGTEAAVIVESGSTLAALNRAVLQAQADVLVIGHLPAGGHLGENGAGYAIIRDSAIPVLSV